MATWGSMERPSCDVGSDRKAYTQRIATIGSVLNCVRIGQGLIGFTKIINLIGKAGEDLTNSV